MNRIFSLAIVTLVVGIGGCREAPSPPSTSQPATATQAKAPPHPKPPSLQDLEKDGEKVEVTLTLPPSSEKITTAALSGHGESCPQSRVSGLLGVEILSPHGIIIGKVLPEGLAAKAGIKPGDSIIEANGSKVTCPSSFEPFLQRSEQAKEIKLTLLRLKQQEQSKTAADSAKPAANEGK